MISHLRANLVLVGGTFLLCSVAYPLVVWVAGCAFPSKANGDIVIIDHKAVGSLLIAQNFTGNEYFQPRPSAASYKADASSASNYGANNPKLRGRVAAQLGPIVKFRNGEPVGPAIEKWFHEKPNRLVEWAETYPTLAGAWLKPDPANDTVAIWLDTPRLDAGFLVPVFVSQELAKHAAIVKAWKEKHPDVKDAGAFFAIFAEEFPDTVPSMNQTNTAIGLGEAADIQAWFFDRWLQENPKVEIEPVPADMVTSSGSGLDPHITLRNAEYQLDRVAAEWSEKKTLDKNKVRKDIEQVLHEKAFTPLLGFGGEPLVNVLEVNLVLHERYGSAAK